MKAIHERPIETRRDRLEAFFGAIGSNSGFMLTPATTDRGVASEWFEAWGAAGLDGVIAKRLGEPYHSGDREGMVKIKHFRDADCVWRSWMWAVMTAGV